MADTVFVVIMVPEKIIPTLSLNIELKKLPSVLSGAKYRLDAEAKGSTGFRILRTRIKSRGR